MLLINRTVLTTLLLLLAACGTTPPSQHYLLSADASGVPGNSGPAIGVGPVRIPDYLKRKNIVINQGRHQLSLAEYDRWAEPLDAGIERVVSVNLAKLMNTQKLQRFPWRRDSPPDYGVSIHLISLSVSDGEAHLNSEWTLTDVSNGATLDQQIATGFNRNHRYNSEGGSMVASGNKSPASCSTVN